MSKDPTKYLHTSERGIRYSRRGSGRPVVFVHGWCLNRKMWAYAEENLCQTHDVLCVDLPGFGQSCDLGGPYTFERFADDLGALVEELHLSGVTLVGFALGAAVALITAEKVSDRVGRVVSVAIPSGEASPYAKMGKAIRRDWPGFARKSAEVLFHHPHSDAEISWLERMFASTELPVALETVNELADLKPEALAAAVTAPQLFLHATEDSVAPIALGNSCVAAAKNARIAVIEDCGHLIVLDDKPGFQAALDAFLQSL